MNILLNKIIHSSYEAHSFPSCHLPVRTWTLIVINDIFYTAGMFIWISIKTDWLISICKWMNVMYDMHSSCSTEKQTNPGKYNIYSGVLPSARAIFYSYSTLLCSSWPLMCNNSADGKPQISVFVRISWTISFEPVHKQKEMKWTHVINKCGRWGCQSHFWCTYVTEVCTRLPRTPQLLCMSAVISDFPKLATWLKITDHFTFFNNSCSMEALAFKFLHQSSEGKVIYGNSEGPNLNINMALFFFIYINSLILVSSVPGHD